MVLTFSTGTMSLTGATEGQGVVGWGEQGGEEGGAGRQGWAG